MAWQKSGSEQAGGDALNNDLLIDKETEMLSQSERISAESKLDALSSSNPLQKFQSPMFFEKLPREIRTIIYNLFDMPSWVFDIPQSGRVPHTIYDYDSQELIDNSLENCLSRKLLCICTQIRDEYKEDAFRVLPTSFHFHADAKAKWFAKRQLAHLPPLINAILVDIAIAKYDTKLTKTRSKQKEEPAPHARYNSIARNIHLVRHLDIRLRIDTYNNTLCRPRKAVSLVAALLAQEIPSEDPSRPILLLSRMTTLSISIQIKNILKAEAPGPDPQVVEKRVTGALANWLGLLWVKGSLKNCNIVVRSHDSEGKGEVMLSSQERRSLDVEPGRVRTVQTIKKSREIFDWDLETCGRTLIEDIDKEVVNLKGVPLR